MTPAAKKKEEKAPAAETDEDWAGDNLEDIDDSAFQGEEGFTDEGDEFEIEKEEEGSDEAAEDGEGGPEEALDELEAEELEMLTEDEEAEALPVDEAAELRHMRREAIALDTSAESAGEDEFVCSNCFLVKRTSQLANRRKLLCRDCA